MLNLKTICLMSVIAIIAGASVAMPPANTSIADKNAAKLEAEITQIINKMTLEEKQAMCHGNGSMDGGGCKRLGISSLRTSDGPLGVSRAGRSTGFGSGMLLAQTWKPRSVVFGRCGSGQGGECRRCGCDSWPWD